MSELVNKTFSADASGFYYIMVPEKCLACASNIS